MATSSAILPKAADRDLIADLTENRPAILDRVAENVARLAAGSTILVVLLVFIFVAKEAWPVFIGSVSTARGDTLLTKEQALKLPKPQLAEYLKRPLADVETLNAETLGIVLDYRNEELSKLSDPQTKVNTVSWPMMLLPFHWDDKSTAEFIWQPNSNVPKFNIVPLLLGSVKIAFIALLIAVPFSLAAALYISQVAPGIVRETVKPAIELLAGFPSIVLGFFGLMILAPMVQSWLGQQYPLNSLIAGICVSFAAIPILFTIAEDALTCVPKSNREAAMAMGASTWHAAVTVILPAAAPGVIAAILLAFGRALGETMIALLCSGNAATMSLSIFDSNRTIPATIGQELAETAFGGIHYGVLFLIGGILFFICFLLNVAGDLVIQRLKNQLQGGREVKPAIASPAIA